MPKRWNLDVRIKYTDGENWAGKSDGWASCRSDGVDEIEISNDGWRTRNVFSGHSVYWLYFEFRNGAPEGYWVAGQGTVANVYNTLPSETMFHRSGEQWSRPTAFMPDLKHGEIKLGWWKRDAGGQLSGD